MPTLRELPTPVGYDTSTGRMIEMFYVPALSAAEFYDRGVGFFTSNWLRLVAAGLAAFAANGGKARILASPKLERGDCDAIARGVDARNDPRLRRALERPLEELEADLDGATLPALAWMIADGLLDFRIAIPTSDLDGDFHDKFGVFRDADDAVAFKGSPNDSERAFHNYESISIYYSWLDDREKRRVDAEKARFERLWGNGDANLRVYRMPDAIRKRLIQYTERTKRPRKGGSGRAESDRWRHQREALAAFLVARCGILEMATGTGKTRTALMIADELRERGLVDCVVVCAFGTDLLDQWHRELVRRAAIPVFRAYDGHGGAQPFLNDPEGSVLLASRQALCEILPRLRQGVHRKALLVCDEVHGMGSTSLVSSLAGRLKPFAYRLGLSATPDREYDAAGNLFIANEIGPKIFEFKLEDAIRQGILCGFDYTALEYEFSADDKLAVRRAIARHHARTKAGENAPPEALYQELARIRKLSVEKLPHFRDFIANSPDVLERSLIFVETAEYGLLVQEALMRHEIDFHTYYGDDGRHNLVLFAEGKLDCLVTCRRISEGIDIRSVNNIILFASSRARLETVQRLGRCLRLDPAHPDKRAKVLDFVRVDHAADDPPGELDADAERRKWFVALASIAREDGSQGSADDAAAA